MPIRKIVYPTPNQSILTTTIEEVVDDAWCESERDRVDAKIKQLLNDISIQEHHIAQASHALNTCASTFEFSGSSESVVAEWKLLITSRRIFLWLVFSIYFAFAPINSEFFPSTALSHEAAQKELKRLRTQKYVRRPDAAQDSGRLTITDITLPLQQQYVSKLATDAIWGHQLVCVLRLSDSEQIVSTKTIPTLPGLLSVKFNDAVRLTNVFSDFRATLDIYGMVSQREVLTHEVKYHIKPKRFPGLGLLTPKSKKTSDSRMLLTPLRTPATADAKRKPNFVHFGSVQITLADIQRTNWPIVQLCDDGPLNGVVSMKVACEITAKVDHQAFLTMFEDVSGFGAWHRRWCHLYGTTLSYWKYPDDMGRVPAIGHIDLALCEQQQIASAPREVCARMNTIMIELRRDAHQPDDKSLNVFRQGDVSVHRLLLSCDTKEQKDEWCAQLNRALHIQATRLHK